MAKLNRFQREIQSIINKNEKDAQRSLYRAYLDLEKDIQKELKILSSRIENDSSFSVELQRARLSEIYLQVVNKLEDLEPYQTRTVHKMLERNYKSSYSSIFYEVESDFKIKTAFTMLPERRINTAIYTPVAGRVFSERLKGHTQTLKQNMNRILTRGYASGESIPMMAKRISREAETTYNRARRIAITESGRVTGAADQQSQQEAKQMGIDLQKMWVSTLDDNTRNSHRQLDSQVVGVDEYFEIDGKKTLQPHLFGDPAEDCNCRCRSVSVVEGISPSLRRDNITGSVIPWKNYEEWADTKNL